METIAIFFKFNDEPISKGSSLEGVDYNTKDKTALPDISGATIKR